jgi:hypothetical protein
VLAREFDVDHRADDLYDFALAHLTIPLLESELSRGRGTCRALSKPCCRRATGCWPASRPR